MTDVKKTVADVESKVSLGTKILAIVFNLFGLRFTKGPKVDKLP